MRPFEEVIRLAMDYDMSDVMTRYAEQTHLPPEVLKEHEREIKRYLAMCAVSPGGYGMRGPLDELWHTFILFTASYRRFCNTLGGGFLDHLPVSPNLVKRAAPGEPPAEDSHKSYLTFLKDYEETFGEKPPAHLWPRPAAGVIGQDANCTICHCHTCERCWAETTHFVSMLVRDEAP